MITLYPSGYGPGKKDHHLMASVTPPQIENLLPMATKDSPMALPLDIFATHGLDDLLKAGLMERFDTKYLLPIGWLVPLLLELRSFYSLLQIGMHKRFTYQSTYFDTPGFDFYHSHHNGKLNRYKVRCRRYVESDTQYLEVKHKNNKKRTHKERVLFNSSRGNRKRINELVSIPFGASRPPLFKSLVCSYERIALADEKNGERLTLDFNLSFKDPMHGRSEQSHQALIAEVKRENRKAPSVFIDRMDLFRQKPVSFSKYCVGCALMHSNRIKTNRFKPTLMALNRISLQETARAA